MRTVGGRSGAALFGSPQQLGVARGLAEVRAGRPVLIEGRGFFVALPVEGLDDDRLAAFRDFCEPIPPELAITAHRAQSLGLDADGPMALDVRPGDDAKAILSFVADVRVDRTIAARPAGAEAAAAVELVKFAQTLPAVLIAEISNRQRAELDPSFVKIEAAAVAGFRASAAQMIEIGSECRIPLASGMRTRFVVFRDPLGRDPVAIVVGAPNPAKPVPVRIHSACLTGDVFGSRRCDCGDQLQLALRRLDEAGGGVVLYLAQEGRGLGLANKMRTYALQDTGLDTVDANTTLGFDDDERDYGVAAKMLEMLGWTKVMLLTNNPTKLEGLAQAGIDIVGRIPLETPIHPENRRYLTTKAARAGHHLTHLLSLLTETSERDDGSVSRVP